MPLITPPYLVPYDGNDISTVWCPVLLVLLYARGDIMVRLHPAWRHSPGCYGGCYGDTLQGDIEGAMETLSRVIWR